MACSHPAFGSCMLGANQGVMVNLEIKRNGRTNQFSIVLVQGSDTIRCMVSVASGHLDDAHSDQEKEQAALRKAKALAQALDAAIGESRCPEVQEGKSAPPTP